MAASRTTTIPVDLIEPESFRTSSRLLVYLDPALPRLGITGISEAGLPEWVLENRVLYISEVPASTVPRSLEAWLRRVHWEPCLDGYQGLAWDGYRRVGNWSPAAAAAAAETRDALRSALTHGLVATYTPAASWYWNNFSPVLEGGIRENVDREIARAAKIGVYLEEDDVHDYFRSRFHLCTEADLKAAEWAVTRSSRQAQEQVSYAWTIGSYLLIRRTRDMVTGRVSYDATPSDRVPEAWIPLQAASPRIHEGAWKPVIFG